MCFDAVILLCQSDINSRWKVIFLLLLVHIFTLYGIEIWLRKFIEGDLSAKRNAWQARNTSKIIVAWDFMMLRRGGGSSFCDTSWDCERHRALATVCTLNMIFAHCRVFCNLQLTHVCAKTTNHTNRLDSDVVNQSVYASLFHWYFGSHVVDPALIQTEYWGTSESNDTIVYYCWNKGNCVRMDWIILLLCWQPSPIGFFGRYLSLYITQLFGVCKQPWLQIAWIHNGNISSVGIKDETLNDCFAYVP